ncbi:MAG: LLM class flavin-dependent oxidoreductase [Actinomycetota bacterium]
MSQPTTYGLFLNMGANLGPTAQDVTRITLEQARRAEAAGFHDLWVTEHHFIPFGINPSALTASAFLLGRTERVRVGTAVTLSPLCNPIELAERSALLDQLSGGRFDLGIGRGGYLKDYEVLDIDTARWEGEPMRTATTLLETWTATDLTRPEHTTGLSELQPAPLTKPHPPLFMATRSPDAIRFAAEHGYPLQHYFASPIEQRNQLEDLYREAASSKSSTSNGSNGSNGTGESVAHLHSLIVVVDDDEAAARIALADALTESFRGGDWPHVPQASGGGHRTSDGSRLERGEMAAYVAKGAIVGSIDEVRDQLAEFQAATGATRLALFVEAIADEARTMHTIDALADAVLVS